MNISSMRFKVMRDTALIVHNCGQNEWYACAVKLRVMGMTPTPPWAGNETARRRAHRLLDTKPNGELNAVGVALIFEPQRSPQNNESEVV
jgi:hypothetical protein